MNWTSIFSSGVDKIVDSVAGNIHMNSFYGYNTAYKTDSGGAPVYFHNNTNGAIV